jgi:hypothetical protein
LAVSFRSASEDARNTTNPPVLVPPSGTQAQDYLLAVQVSDHRGSLSAMVAPDGSWSLLGSTSRSDVGFVKVWRRIATASEPAEYEWTDSTSAQSSVIIVALTGYDPSQPLAVTPTFSNGASSSTHPAPSVTGVADGMLITAHIGGTNGTTRSYTSFPSGMSRAQDSALSSGGYIVLGVFYQALTGAGATGSKIATCSTSTPFITMSLVVQQPSTLVISPSGINSTAVVGTPAVAIDGGEQTVTATGIPTGQAFGTPTVTVPELGGPFPGSLLFPGSTLFPGTTPDAPLDQTVTPAAIGSAEAFGSPIVGVSDGTQVILAIGIDSGELFPIPEVILDPLPPQTIEPIGITTGEVFGRPTLTLEIPTPSPTEADQYFIDAISLRNDAIRIETAEGLLDTPAPVGDNVALPGRDGELQVFGDYGQPRRADSLGRITFDLWLKGLDPTTGLVPGGSSTQEEWFKRWDDTVRRFFRRRVVIDHARPDGTIRRAFAHLMPGESITPSRVPSSPWFGRFRAVFAIPAGHWTDLTPVTTGAQPLVTNGFLDLSVFAPSTAPCTELQVVFHAGNNPRLSTSTGHIGWNGVITSGRQLGIDTATGLTHQASGASWVPGFDGLTYSPGPRLFEVDPSEPLGAIFTHTTGAGQTMTVEVTGKRRYRTS